MTERKLPDAGSGSFSSGGTNSLYLFNPDIVFDCSNHVYSEFLCRLHLQGGIWFFWLIVILKDTVNDVVVGRQVSARVLTKRIRMHLLHSSKPSWLGADTVRLRDTLINFERREVRCNGVVRRLKGVLPDLLRYFLDNPNRAVSREELMESPIWADTVLTTPKEGGKTFDVAMSKLRNIIEQDPRRPQIIKTIRKAGWILLPDGTVQNRDEKINAVLKSL